MPCQFTLQYKVKSAHILSKVDEEDACKRELLFHICEMQVLHSMSGI